MKDAQDALATTPHPRCARFNQLPSRGEAESRRLPRPWRGEGVTFEPRRPHHGTTLLDILDRILDKGLVVAGDERVSLANVELLTTRIRLLVCSIDKAEQIGLNWWHYDRSLIAQEEATTTIMRLENRITELADSSPSRYRRLCHRTRRSPLSGLADPDHERGEPTPCPRLNARQAVPASSTSSTGSSIRGSS